MYYSDEQVARAFEKSITEYFRMNGYSVDREGREMHIHGFGGLKVREDTKQWYVHSQQIGGVGLVDCLRKLFGLSYPDALCTALDGEQPGSAFSKERKFPNGDFPFRRKPAPEKEVKVFTMPQKNSDNRRVFAYLTKQRGISPRVVNELINSGLLFQDMKGNAVFLDINEGKPCGGEFHGTGMKNYTIGKAKFNEIENRQLIKVEPYIAEAISSIFKDDNSVSYVGYVYATEANIAADPENIRKISEIADALRNSDLDIDTLNAEVKKKLKSFNGVLEGTADNFFEYKPTENPVGAYVFESAIDLMSFMNLHPEAKNCEFVSMGGLKHTVVDRLLERGLKVALCVDNDEKGHIFCDKFTGRCAVMTECQAYGVKDYNELLQKIMPKRSFIGEVSKMSEWADKVQQKALAEREANRVAYRNQPVKA